MDSQAVQVFTGFTSTAMDHLSGEVMNASSIFYLCPTCFYASDIPDSGHEHTLLRVDPGLPGDERRKPIIDQHGHILSPAPRWFHEAVFQTRLTPRSSV
jgi:hypothetical protein